MILLYSLPNCKWCILAKDLLKSNNITFKTKEIDINKKQDFKDAMKFKTFPLIFDIDGKHKIRIGGYQELATLITIRNNLRKYDISVKSLESFHKTIKSLKNERQLKTLFDMNHLIVNNNINFKQIRAFP
jgi:glutaredoxin